jgi:hypothetical protein
MARTYAELTQTLANPMQETSILAQEFQLAGEF